MRVFVDVISGRQFERPGLSELIDHARVGDSLCVTRLDRLGCSLKELLETVENLKAHDIHLVSLEERIDTTSAGGSSPSVRATELRPPENGAGGQGDRHWLGRPYRPRKPSSRLA